MAKIGGVTAPAPSGVAPGGPFVGTDVRPWRKIPMEGTIVTGAGVIRFVHHTGVDPSGNPVITLAVRVIDNETGLVILNLVMNAGDSQLVYIPFNDGISEAPTYGAPQCIIAGE